MILTRGEQIPSDALTPHQYATHILRALDVKKPSPGLRRFTAATVWIIGVTVLIAAVVVSRVLLALALGIGLAAEALYRAWGHAHPHISPVMDQLAQGQRVKEVRTNLNLSPQSS